MTGHSSLSSFGGDLLPAAHVCASLRYLKNILGHTSGFWHSNTAIDEGPLQQPGQSGVSTCMPTDNCTFEADDGITMTARSISSLALIKVQLNSASNQERKKTSHRFGCG
jgi:hypothetical protein